MSTPKEALAFSADKLVYIKPFISKLQSNNGLTEDLTSRVMARQIIDELLKDILEEITASCDNDKSVEKISSEYGLNVLTANSVEEFYYTKVA
jgi:hypothetical protein